MRFKNSRQRKAVMAKLKNSSFKQIQRKGMFLRYQGDADKDGVVNIKDCRPLDPKRQGIIHDLIKKKESFEKKRSKNLEKEQDRLLKNIDKESTTLNKTLKVQKKIAENKALKNQLSELKRQNFQQTKAGKVVVVTRKGLIKIGEVTRAGAKLAWKKYKKEYL